MLLLQDNKDNENEFVRTEEVEFPFKKGDPIFINEVLKCKNFRGLLNTKGVKNDN